MSIGKWELIYNWWIWEMKNNVSLRIPLSQRVSQQTIKVRKGRQLGTKSYSDLILAITAAERKPASGKNCKVPCGVLLFAL